MTHKRVLPMWGDLHGTPAGCEQQVQPCLKWSGNIYNGMCEALRLGLLLKGCHANNSVDEFNCKYGPGQSSQADCSTAVKHFTFT